MFFPKMGIEVELFLIDKKGKIANVADSILSNPELKNIIVPECNHCLLEVHTPPLSDLQAIDTALTQNITALIKIAHQKELLLLPSTSIGTARIKARNGNRYRIKEKILGKDKRLLEYHIGGTHFHIDLHNNIAKQYKLFYALDPSFTFLASSPFFLGNNSYHDHRAYIYRNVVFEKLPEFAKLHNPSKNPIEVYKNLYTYWEDICKKNNIKFTGFTPLNTYWGPLRFTKKTIENRGPDNNLKSNILALAALYMGINRQIDEIGNIKISNDKHSQLVEKGIKIGLADEELKIYLQKLVDKSKKGLLEHELKYLEPLERMLESKKTFSCELTDYAKNNGLYNNGQIDEKSAKKIRLYAAKRFYEDALL